MTLAEKMIILSGKHVRHAPARTDDEIEIKVTGLRPGEKLYHGPVDPHGPQAAGTATAAPICGDTR